MYRLDEKHLEQAKVIAAESRKKKNCKNCYDRGYIGVTPENTLVLCHKCVDLEKSYAKWKEYVSKFPDLKEQYKELFEEDTEEENKEEDNL